ncbi:MAG: hypothetical protein HY721_08085 [Planctomycetes bacterium]|nr:hypothetical protein [Planctomycetota bacterium]
MIQRTSRAHLAALALGGLLAARPARGDSIELLNGTRHENVQVLSAKWDELQYKQGSNPPVRLEGSRVASIARDSNILQSPRAALDAGEYPKALQELTQAAARAPTEWEKAEAAYRIGQAHRGAGKYKEAETAYKDYKTKHGASKDWFVPHATAEIGETLLAARQPGTAELAFKELEQYGGQWAFLSKLGQAEAMVQRGKTELLPARTLCDRVVRDSSAPLSFRHRAYVIRAKIFLLQEQPQGAIKELGDAFFSSAKSSEVDYSPARAEATLLMGRAHVALGGKENLEQAEIWLLRVSALYRRHGAVYAQACDALAEVYEKLGNAARASEWKNARRQGAGAAQVAAPAPAAPARKNGGNGVGTPNSASKNGNR